MTGPTTPRINSWFRLFPLHSPLLWESLIDFFSSAYWDVSLRQVSLFYPMYSDKNDGLLLPSGFPIRNSSGHSFFPALRSLSQVSTSFFACWYQGIHQQPLAAWSLYHHPLLRMDTGIVFFLLLCSITDTGISRIVSPILTTTFLWSILLKRHFISVKLIRLVNLIVYLFKCAFTLLFLRILSFRHHTFALRWMYDGHLDFQENKSLQIAKKKCAVTKTWTWDLDIISVAL